MAENTTGAPVRQHWLFAGRIQGVGFRWDMQRKASELSIVGWVKNLDEGFVEAEVQGNSINLTMLKEYLINQRLYQIDKLDIQQLEIDPEEKNFRIFYY